MLFSPRYLRRSAACLACAVLLFACGPTLRPAVDLKLRSTAHTPADASVVIDEEYIGPLGYVAAHGVRLPQGEHRVSVTKSGYFPWDQLVVSDREPIFLDVELTPIPD